MLILAGVSINAIVGDNGVLTRTQYASFLNEMAAVEEAVQLWKAGETIEAGGEETKAIPANGLCKANELTATERLVGEVGYYRIWSMSETKPSTDILSDASTFNSSFESELIFYPAGVQDLYYLNNEALEIKGNKTYLIDASTGMIYSMTGIGLKGVRCYSSNMAKAVMNGESTMPLFAEAEVSGTGSDEKLAGNTEPEFLEDGSENPNYNPYGFKIITSNATNNVFKLYNNGDLYGKGVKGIQLNSSEEEIEKINPYIWKPFKTASNIANISKTIVGYYCMFYLTDKGELYVEGSNDYNRFGLTSEQMLEYTGRTAIKINLKNSNGNSVKVKDVFSTAYSTFIVDTDNNLYTCGLNGNGELGIGTNVNPTTFTLVPDFNKSDKIKQISHASNGGVFIGCSDNTFYFCGINSFGQLGKGTAGEKYSKFIQVFDGNMGPDIDQDIMYWQGGINVTVVKKDGTAWSSGYDINTQNYVSEGSSYTFRQLLKISGCKMFLGNNNSTQCFVCEQDGTTKVYIVGHIRYTAGSDFFGKRYTELANLPTELTNEGIKDISSRDGQFYFLSNTGKLYGTGSYSGMGMNISSGQTANVEYIQKSGVTDFCNDLLVRKSECNTYIFINCNGNIEITGNQELMYRDGILQVSWKKVASNVAYFDGIGTTYVDKDGNVYVSGKYDNICLGDESKLGTTVQNYTLLDDERINGKAVLSTMCRNCLYVLTKDGILYGGGKYEANGGPDNTGNYPGWNDKQDKYRLIEILTNVKDFIAENSGGSYSTKFAILNDGTSSVWGTNGNYCFGVEYYKKDIPNKYTLPNKIGGNDNISKIVLPDSYRSFILTKDYKVYMGGTHSGHYTGGNGTANDFAEYTNGLSLQSDEYVCDIACSESSRTIFLTNKGRIFAYGNENLIGIGSSNTNNATTQLVYTSESDDKVVQISAGVSNFFAITEKGKVYATGSNSYGVLGRWIGIDRNTENSRYKTALNWVECPELEI